MPLRAEFVASLSYVTILKGLTQTKIMTRAPTVREYILENSSHVLAGSAWITTIIKTYGDYFSVVCINLAALNVRRR